MAPALIMFSIVQVLSALILHFILLQLLKNLSWRIDLFLMIHIEETILNPNTITIKLEGVLDLAALPVIQGVFERCLEKHLAIQLDLGGLIHITREGRNFLNEIKQNVNLVHLPEFMQLETSQNKG